MGAAKNTKAPSPTTTPSREYVMRAAERKLVMLQRGGTVLRRGGTFYDADEHSMVRMNIPWYG